MSNNSTSIIKQEAALIAAEMIAHLRDKDDYAWREKLSVTVAEIRAAQNYSELRQEAHELTDERRFKDLELLKEQRWAVKGGWRTLALVGGFVVGGADVVAHVVEMLK